MLNTTLHSTGRNIKSTSQQEPTPGVIPTATAAPSYEDLQRTLDGLLATSV